MQKQFFLAALSFMLFVLIIVEFSGEDELGPAKTPHRPVPLSPAEEKSNGKPFSGGVGILAPATIGITTPPPGVDEYLWRDIYESAKQLDNPSAEIWRQFAYYKFHHELQRFYTIMNDQSLALESREMAKVLQEQLENRVHNGEMTIGEAISIKYSLVTFLYPDERQSNQILNDWISSFNQTSRSKP